MVTKSLRPVVLSYLGKEGEAMLMLWKAQVEWLALVGVNSIPTPQDPPPDRDQEQP